jgi:hypothetical protein
MNPQTTYLLAVDHARDLRRDAEAHRRAALSSTTSNRLASSLQTRGAVSRPSLLRRLRLA